jgi:hypothetical protein
MESEGMAKLITPVAVTDAPPALLYAGDGRDVTLWLQTSGSAVTVGDSAVTATTGPVLSGDIQLDISGNTRVYGICATGLSSTVRGLVISR